MKRIFYTLICLAGLMGDAVRVSALEVLPLTLSQSTTPNNSQSQRGAPISTVINTPPGSDGRLSTVNSSLGSINPATGRQFQGLVSFGGVTAPSDWRAAGTSPSLESGTNAFSYQVAAAMQLPVARTNGNADNSICMVLRRAQIGAPYMSRQVSFAFGSNVPVPGTDEYGVMLSTNIVRESYWQPEPWSASGHTNDQYYWSPNAQVVFAVQTGPISITWRKAVSYPLGTQPAYTNLNGTASFETNGGNVYLLYTASYVVSGNAVKTPQKMYWTEGSFQTLGYPISVPSARASAIHVVYNSSFPEKVQTTYPDPNYVSPVSSTNMYQELRTLWFDSSVKQIRAYNAEGRVFVELLGAPNPNGIGNEFLGFEIVDVYKAPVPSDITIELGEKLLANQDGADEPDLAPSPIQNNLGQQFYYPQTASAGQPLYADRETQNKNDLQVHWLATGVAGLQWPNLFVRYALVWPSDAARYSHYLRPQVATQAEAMQTAVQLDGAEAPSLDYQDSLDQTRGWLTPTYTFYTYLTPAHPAHRALLRFLSGTQVRFERVFSWLDAGVKSNALLTGSVAVNLNGWNSTNSTLTFPNPYATPYVLSTTVNVGDRINAPVNELGAAGSYWAGYLRQTNGTSFNPNAYADPFTFGFEQANRGAIIPVNAIPGKNLLEVWWFRQNTADAAQGFQPIYWPTVIGRYTIQWPNSAPEIIMAGNAGSGALPSLQAKGSIYYQNSPALPGYNPNEEHAVMLGGQAYALRDDLNITSPSGYSSDRFVLINYSESDGRPAMSVFKVRREKPEANILFDYIVNAGTLLQAPMPLPLMEPPLEGTGALAKNYNTEPSATSGDLPVGWSAANASGPYSYYQTFTFQDRKHNFWVYRGPHAGLPPLRAGLYNSANGSFSALPSATAVISQTFNYFVHVSRRLDSLTISLASGALPNGLSLLASTNGLGITGVPTALGSTLVSLAIRDAGDGSVVTNSLSINVIASGTAVAQGPLAITSTNQYSGAMVTYVDRPPSLAQSPAPSNSFTMQYYYKTLPGFAWPGVATPPSVGAIVPYLRPANGSGGFLGDATQKTTPSLNIVYRPAWPQLGQDQQPLPTLLSGQTLTTPINGLAAVRGQSSVQVLYQQSVGTNITASPVSVVLQDPTVQKTSSLAALKGLPTSVVANSYQGKMYFQNLPPNLVNRLYFDPASTNLVFQGQFVDELVGEKYLLLNVLRGADLSAVTGLCTPSDPNYSAWVSAVVNLSTPVYTFHEHPAAPGSYVVDSTQTVTRKAGDLVEVYSSDTAVDSYALSATGPGQGYVTYIVGNGGNPAHAAEPVSIYVARVIPPLFPGQLKVIEASNPLSEMITFQHTADLAGRAGDYEYDWRIMPPVDGSAPTEDKTKWVVLADQTDLTHYTLGGSGIQALSDNYITMRYRCTNALANPAITNWSSWTDAQLVEGWIKRVLAGINPFNQRTTDLFDNPVNTTASIISQAGHRWEGDVPLNQDALNNAGLIEIYETVLNRGKMLSINAGYNYGPANDALLLASGYLNDLYMMLGNEAWSDAANPTIGIGTANKTYGDVATALFAFKGQEASLLEEELALLRGRDDSLAPGVKLNPAYNRLYWNYTRGIDAGEVIYALNYNILDQNADGVVNAADAAFMYPQGHGDAYGHYLTAMKNYYSLLMSPNFDWVPRIEAVTVLGATVSVDYQDERKFAASAAAVARAGRQAFDLTWRQTYQPGTAAGWSYFATNTVGLRTYKDGSATHSVTRYWGMDHWASRVGQGAYVNWVVGNSILPPVDPDPSHSGIQKVDRTTVPELKELPQTAAALENEMDNANAGFTPLGLSQNSVPFDINPLQVTGADPKTHFEQVYQRAVSALNNAVVAFDDAQNVTQMIRSEEDSLSDFAAGVTSQELAYNNQLTTLYGTPYPDDMGPGQTYPQGYTGPDLIHYTYVENPDTNSYGGILPDPTTTQTFKIDIQSFPADWQMTMYQNFDFNISSTSASYSQNTNYVSFNIGPNGFFDKPAAWTGSRVSPGSIQQSISTLIAAQNKLRQELNDAVNDKQALDKAAASFKAQVSINAANLYLQNQTLIKNQDINNLQSSFAISDKWLSLTASVLADQMDLITSTTPDEVIFGLANGGDFLKTAKIMPLGYLDIAKEAVLIGDAVSFSVVQANIVDAQKTILGYSQQLANNQYSMSLQNSVNSLGEQLNALQGHLSTINQDQRALDDAKNAYRAQVAQGNRLQQERLTFRQHASAVVQGYRTRDAAFRLFQNEKLERYKTLFDLAAKYAYLSANAYDYETGLLNTDQGRAFVNRIISSRALGVIKNGAPQYAGSNTGDPGLSSALAEMKADWDVLKGRLGFNNPDGYGTTASLRTENYRIIAGADGDNNWKSVLQQGRVADLLADSDVKRHCLQIDDGTGQAVPGIVLTFSTVIADGQNLFGQPLGAGDHNYSPSSFATKIFSVGVDLDGYIGMNNPTANSGAGGISPSDPTFDPNGLAATPYVYLIPVGADAMRSPPLGDTSTIRTWNVDDLTIPLPFNISASDFSSAPFYTAADSLSEPLFGVRKHQAFRPVSSTTVFNTSIYGANGALQPSQYTNKRLIGRSVWNSKWKLVIPGKTLLADPNQGLDRLIASLKDVKLYFITYSYSGN